MTIRVVPDHDVAGWDHFVGQFPSATPFHTKAWVGSFANEHLTPVYLRLLSDGRAIGGAAGLIVDPEPAFLRRIDREVIFFSGAALAETPGPLVRDCTFALIRYAKEEGLTGLTSLGRDYPYAFESGDSGIRAQLVHEYIIDLSGSWDGIRARMRRSIAEQARQAERAGLTFHERYDVSPLTKLLPLLESTRSRKPEEQFSFYYLPYLSQGVLASLCETELAWFFVATRGADVLCVLLVFAFHARAYALLIGCSEEGYRLRAPAFVWLNAIRSLKALGVESLNLSGAWPGSKLAFAKASLGAERRACMGCVSPYLQGPLPNLLFQIYRWRDNLSALGGMLRRQLSQARTVVKGPDRLERKT